MAQLKLTYRQSRWQRMMQQLPASAIGAWIFSPWLHGVDRPLMRLSHHRLTIPGLLTGLPVVLLTSTGARSGQPRTTPVVGVPDGDAIVLVASNWGQPHHPAWYYNLRAHPDADLAYGGHTGRYTAHEVTDPEVYQRLWQQATAVYRGFASYQRRASTRTIPIMRMVPHGTAPA